MPPIRISRQGLSRCPTCKSHIKVAAVIQETRCPFCDSTLDASPGALSLSLTPSSRSALVAASLFASSGFMPGCGSDDPAPTDAAVADTAPDSASDTAVDSTWNQEVVEDIGPVAEYGMPPDAMWDTAADAGDVEVVEDAIPMPEYGMPPDAGEQPAYGIPADAE